MTKTVTPTLKDLGILCKADISACLNPTLYAEANIFPFFITTAPCLKTLAGDFFASFIPSSICFFVIIIEETNSLSIIIIDRETS